MKKLFDSGRGSGAKRQRWSCKCLSPPLHLPGSGSSRRVEEGEGSTALPRGLQWGCGTPGTPSNPLPAAGRCVRPPFGAGISITGAKMLPLPQGAAPAPSTGMLGWVSVSQQPRIMDGQTDRQTFVLLAALRQLRRCLRWARLLRELEMGTRAAFVHHCRQPRRAPRAGIPTVML